MNAIDKHHWNRYTVAEDEEGLLRRYKSSWKENMFEECEMLAKKLIKIDNQKSDYFHLRGNCLTQMKLYEEAANAHKQAISMEKKSEYYN